MLQVAALRHDWSRQEVRGLFALPFPELIYRAQSVHREHFAPEVVQISTLLSVKTGGCPEDCAYCGQSARYDTAVDANALLTIEEVRSAAAAAQAAGATRFCMGAAWRAPRDREVEQVCAMVEAVRELGLESCATLGMLTRAQADRLKAAGLDFYNHNLDTSPEYYGQVVHTRTYADRLQTLEHVRTAGIKVCCGGILGLGEGVDDRAELIRTLANLPQHPESVPINVLVRVAGTPLAEQTPVEPLDVVKTIAAARICMPASVVRLSAGREGMSDELQALCFIAGANSIFYGPRLLTTPNPPEQHDHALFEKLGLAAQSR